MLNLYPHDLIDSGIFISEKLNFHIIIKMSSICGVIVCRVYIQKLYIMTGTSIHKTQIITFPIITVISLYLINFQLLFINH